MYPFRSMASITSCNKMCRDLLAYSYRENPGFSEAGDINPPIEFDELGYR
jgi:hypothetical protein